jgi:cell division protein FtsB
MINRQQIDEDGIWVAYENHEKLKDDYKKIKEENEDLKFNNKQLQKDKDYLNNRIDRLIDLLIGE